MEKKGYSRKGFFGETIHYDTNGKKIGESRKNFWGGMDHFDASGHKVGESRKNFFGGMNHYDTDKWYPPNPLTATIRPLRYA